ncbi:hypothetical protein B6U74_05380 [Candidatus Bathyarchaeota archaeon ex4484_205]|nr:MAG: hypothetical protein B6U74_05380 [Candidatus Bathyarchaeota archaeon ex4484_205]
MEYFVVKVQISKEVDFNTARAVADTIAFREYKVRILGWRDLKEGDWYPKEIPELLMKEKNVLEVVVNDGYRFYYKLEGYTED